MSVAIANTTSRRVDQIVFREDLYPRIKHDPALVQRYAENLEVLPPIEINQHDILIDGWHRWTAHRKVEAAEVPVTVTETASEAELFALAIRRNAAHGWQMAEPDKKAAAVRLYAAGTGLTKEEIAATLSVSARRINDYLTDIDKQLREDRRRRIFELWLSCHTQEEIASQVGYKDHKDVSAATALLRNLAEFPNSAKVVAEFGDSSFTVPLFNVWRFGKLNNDVAHFGNSEQTILENLLYLYTEPFDIVLDPFAGGGSTIDICRKRLRRFWASDRKPIVEREGEIRKLDIVQELPPLHNRWSEVALTYLDPPYWRQAKGKYSDDAEDLANMPLDEFSKALAGVVRGIASKQSKGVIALLIQPTQWTADERQFTDHVFDLITAVGNKRLTLENRVSCPYQSEQYHPQQVEWAKANRKLLVLTRELIIWRLG